MNSTVKTIVFWLVIVLSAVLLWQVVKAGSSGPKEKTISFSEFLSDVDQAKVAEVTITGTEVRGKFKDDPKQGFNTTVPANTMPCVTISRIAAVRSPADSRATRVSAINMPSA